MGRARRLVLPVSVVEFGESGELGPRIFAVERTAPGHRVDPWQLGGGHEIPGVDDPGDATQRNSLLGVPMGYETETGKNPLTGKQETIRRVVQRTEPVEFGGYLRWEERHLDGDGPDAVEISREIRFGRLSEFRRACPDQTEKRNRQRLGIVGAPAPGKVFRLASR